MKPHIDSEGGLLLGAIQRQLQTANDLIKQGQKSYHGLADHDAEMTRRFDAYNNGWLAGKAIFWRNTIQLAGRADHARIAYAIGSLD